MSTISASTTSTTAFKITTDTTGALVFQTGASPTTALTIDGSQNVGIGYTTPSTYGKLAVNGSIAGSNFNIQAGSAGTYGLADLSAAIQTYSGSASPANSLLFYTNGAERARITANGSLQVGTTAGVSSNSLFVGGNISNAGGGAFSLYYNSMLNAAQNADIYITSNYASRYYQYLGAHYWNIAPSGTAGATVSYTQAMTLDASGRLTVNSVGVDNIMTLTSTAGGYSSRINLGSSSGGGAVVNGDYNLLFYVGNSQRGAFDSTGNFSITQSPGKYTIDSTPGAANIANNGTVDFPNSSGMLVVNNWATGAVTIWLCGGGNTSAIANVTGAFGTLSYVSGIGGYRWTNNIGYAAVFGFFFVRTRTTA